MPQQRALVEDISAKYVKMIATLHGNIDYIFRIYPYAIASGVCWGFHYLFPGSRHLYSAEFKNDVYLFVCQLLLGLKLSSVSVQSMRRQYFPDEVLDDANGKGKLFKAPMSASGSGSGLGGGASSASIGSLSTLAEDLAFLPRIQSAPGFEDDLARRSVAANMKKSVSESYLGKQALNDNTVERILETTCDDTSNSVRLIVMMFLIVPLTTQLT